jgi:hypothetical protein
MKRRVLGSRWVLVLSHDNVLSVAVELLRDGERLINRSEVLCPGEVFSLSPSWTSPVEVDTGIDGL